MLTRRSAIQLKLNEVSRKIIKLQDEIQELRIQEMDLTDDLRNLATEEAYQRRESERGH